MTKQDLKLYQEAKKSNDTNALLWEELRKSNEALGKVHESLNKPSSTEQRVYLNKQDLMGPGGLQGDTGERGSRFLGSFATAADLPEVDGVIAMPGDFAYVQDPGELWYIEGDLGAGDYAHTCQDTCEGSLIVIRHGTTALNEKDQIRGWKDVPLSDIGIEETHQLAEQLKGFPMDGILTSDLIRAQQTADIISKTTGIPVLGTDFNLRPWNLGKLTGQPTEKVLPKLKEYAMRPTEPVDGGESFNDFRTRFLDNVRKVLKDLPGKHIGIVTHHRGERLIESWIKKGMPENNAVDMNVFLRKGNPPASAKELKITNGMLYG